MKPYYDLNQAGQTRRLAKMAELAIAEFHVGPVRLRLVRNGHNALFRATSEKRNDAGGKEEFALRICRPGYQTPDELRSETTFLQAIQENTNLRTPTPLRTISGDWLTTIETEGVPEARQITLAKWETGRFLRRNPGAHSLERLGTFMATLHRFAEQWQVPPGFTRKRWDSVGLSGHSLGVNVEEARAAFTHEQRDLIERMNERGANMMSRLGEGKDVFGVIHADLHLGNSLFEKGDMCAIDFDDCGWGYYLYDLAVTFSSSSFFHRKDFHEMRASVIRGYRRVRPLSDETFEDIETFVHLRHAGMMVWMMGNRQDIFIQKLIEHRLPQYVEVLKNFLNATSR